MKLNTEQIEKLKAILGERKFNETVFGFNYDENKIYLYKSNSIYKLHYANCKFSFIDLNSSVCHANGYSDTAQEALSNIDFKEFNSIEHAIKEGFFN